MKIRRQFPVRVLQRSLILFAHRAYIVDLYQSVLMRVYLAVRQTTTRNSIVWLLRLWVPKGLEQVQPKLAAAQERNRLVAKGAEHQSPQLRSNSGRLVQVCHRPSSAWRETVLQWTQPVRAASRVRKAQKMEHHATRRAQGLHFQHGLCTKLVCFIETCNMKL